DPRRGIAMHRLITFVIVCSLATSSVGVCADPEKLPDLVTVAGEVVCDANKLIAAMPPGDATTVAVEEFEKDRKEKLKATYLKLDRAFAFAGKVDDVTPISDEYPGQLFATFTVTLPVSKNTVAEWNRSLKTLAASWDKEIRENKVERVEVLQAQKVSALDRLKMKQHAAKMTVRLAGDKDELKAWRKRQSKSVVVKLTRILPKEESG